MMMVTALIAMRRSAKKMENLKDGDQIKRKQTIADLRDDLLASGLHAINIHDKCRKEICKPISQEFQTQFDIICQEETQDIPKDQIINKLKKFLNRSAEVKGFKNQIVKQVKNKIISYYIYY
jgi:hypothetical protein